MYYSVRVHAMCQQTFDGNEVVCGAVASFLPVLAMAKLLARPAPFMCIGEIAGCHLL